MPRNAGGIYTLPAGNPVVSGTVIQSTWANNTLSDVANEITNSLDRAGRGSMTAPLKLSDGTAAAPGLTFNSEPTSGTYRSAAGAISMSILTTAVLTFTAAGTVFLKGFTSGSDTGFWPDVAPNTARINFARDRLFVQGGTAFTGNRSGTQGGFVPTSAEGANWAPRDSRVFVAADTGLIQIAGFVSNANIDTTGGEPTESIGVAGYSINNKANRKTWALYSDVQHESAGLASYGLEVAAKNKGSDVIATPYGLGDGVEGVRLAGGGDASYGGSPTNPSKAAIVILNGASTWNDGIVFKDGGLTVGGGVSRAVSMGVGMQLYWYTAAGAKGFVIRSENNSAASDVTVLAQANALLLTGNNGKRFAQFVHTASGVNFVNTTSAVAGASPIIAAAGDDANVGLRFSGKGTFGIGVNTAPVANIPIKVGVTAGGSQIAQQWTDGTLTAQFQTSATTWQFGATTNHGLELFTNNIVRASVAAAGNVTITAPSSGNTLTLGQVAGSHAWVADNSLSGGIASALLANSSNTANSDARLYIQVGGASGGDPFMHMQVAGVTDWAFGVDNSDSDTWKVCSTSALDTTNNRFNITTDGRIYGNALHNNAGSVTGTTNQYIASGTWNPTISAGANLGASTVNEGQWIRVGNVVSWSFNLTQAMTANNTLSGFEFSLPIASNFTSIGNMSGGVNRRGAAGSDAGYIVGSIANDTGVASWFFTTTGSNLTSLSGSYVIL